MHAAYLLTTHCSIIKLEQNNNKLRLKLKSKLLTLNDALSGIDQPRIQDETIDSA